MKFCPSVFVCCAILGSWLAHAQTPPPGPPNRAGAPQPTVTLGVDDPKPRPPIPPDKVIISVGDVKITVAQFDMICDSLPDPSQRASAKGPARKLFADQLVRVLVLAQEGKRRKLDEDANYKMATLIHNDNLLAGLTFQQLGKESKLTDDDMRAYYDKHVGEYETVHAYQILVRMQGSPIAVKAGQKDLTDAEALAKAQELRAKLVAGADFGTLALAESDDAQSAAKGGDLGTFKRGHMVPAAEDAAFALKPGEISQPVRSQLGYHVIKLESKTTSKTFDEARPELEGKMRPEAARKALEELQKNSSILVDPDFFGLSK